MTAPQSHRAEQSFWQRYRRLLPHLKPARWPFLGGVLSGLVFAGASGLGLPLVLYAVAPVIFGSADGQTRQSEQVKNWAIWLFGNDYSDKLLLVACLGLPVIFLIRGISAILNRYLINQAGFLMLEGLRAEVFNRLQELPLAYHQKHKSGDLTSRLMGDTEQLKNVVVMLSADIFKQPFTLIAALVSLLYLAITNRSAVFVIIALISVPLCIVPIRVVARRIIKKSRQLTQQTGELTAVVTESLQSPMEIQAYNLQQHQNDRFLASVRSIFRLAMKTVKYQSFTNPVIEFISACGFMVAMYFGVRHGMDFKVFSALGMALFMAYEPAKKLSNLHAIIKIGDASLERLEEVLDAKDTVPQPPNPQLLPAGQLDINFSHVSFTYESRESGDTESPALIDINVTIRPGEVVALVGPSGAGKSTFVALIPRFYDPTSGGVNFGGVDLRTVDKKALRDRVAIVPQMPTLFNTTIGNNIRIGRDGATDAEVREAAKNAFVADFIERLPQGYETMVGERGATLSGGQRQRMAIARAFLKNAPILILDEATSALDSESEAKVQQALTQLVQGRTTFMIAHRFSSLSLATRVLVFEGGRITGDGTAAELKRTHPGFRRMAELQQLK